MTDGRMEATRQIAEIVCGYEFDGLPEIVVERAKLAILDTIGVMLAGSGNHVLDLLVDAATGTTGPALLAGRDQRVPPAIAAYLNGCAAHILDYDDSGHSSAHLVPTVLAVGEDTGASGTDLLTAYVAGREVRMRLNEEIDTGRFDLKGRGPGARGWHAAGTLGSLGSAVAGARLHGLDGERTAMAIGHAASLASGVISNFGTMTKCVHVGNAARNGVEASSLVRRGLTADPTVLTSTKGFIDAMCLEGECDVDAIVERMRRGFHLEEHGNRIKPYPSCSGSHRFIEATRLLIGDRRLTADEVASITCTEHPSLVSAMPTNDIEIKFSSLFTVAVTLLEGAVTLDNCTAEYLARPDIQALLARSAEVPKVDEGWVRVELRSGEVLEHTIVPARSLGTYDEIAAKFHECAAGVVGEVAADAIEEAVRNLEHVEHTTDLTRHLVPLRTG